MIPRLIILWMAIIPIAVLNGVLREKLLRPRLGPRLANTVSGLALITLVVAFASATIGWLPRLPTAGYLLAGAAWLLWTVMFEFAFGRLVARSSWRDLTDAYRFRNGNIWPLVLATIALAPWIAATVRGLRLTD